MSFCMYIDLHLLNNHFLCHSVVFLNSFSIILVTTHCRSRHILSLSSAAAAVASVQSSLCAMVNSVNELISNEGGLVTVPFLGKLYFTKALETFFF